MASEWDGWLHPLGAWAQALDGVDDSSGSQESAVDTISMPPKGPPFTPGTFSMTIPWEFKVGDGTPKIFCNTANIATVDWYGYTEFTKQGAGLAAGAGAAAYDPDSSY